MSHQGKGVSCLGWLLFGVGLCASAALGELRAQIPAAGGKRPSAAAPGLAPNVDPEGFPFPREALFRLGSRRMRMGSISALAYSADMATIIAVGGSNVIHFWDAATGDLRCQVETQEGSPSLLTCGSDNVVHFFTHGLLLSLDASTGKEMSRFTLPTTDPTQSACFSADGNTLAVAQQGTIRLFDVGTGRDKGLIVHSNPSPPVIALSPDAQTLFVGDKGDILRWDTVRAAVKDRVKTPFESVAKIAISGDGKRMVAWDRNPKAVIIWDLRTAKEICRPWNEVKYPREAAFSPNGKLLALYTCYEPVRLYETATGKQVGHLKTGLYSSTFAFSQDGRKLVAGGEGALGQWAVDSGKMLAASADPQGSIWIDRFCGTDKILLVSNGARMLHDLKHHRLTERVVAPVDYSSARAILSPDGKRWAAASYKNAPISMRDSATGKEIYRLRTPCSAWSMLFSNDGSNLLVDYGKDGVVAYDVATGKELYRLTGNSLPLDILVLSPDGKWLAGATNVGTNGPNDDRDLRIWDLSHRRLWRRIKLKLGAAYRVAFSSDSRVIAVISGEAGLDADGGAVSFVDVESGKERLFLTGLEDGIKDVAFSPDGRTLATINDESPRLWEIATRSERHRFVGHTSLPGPPAFSPDGGLLATSSNDAPVYVWDLYGNRRPGALRHEPWSKKEQDTLWSDLASADSYAAFESIRRLACNPESGIALLRQRLHPAEAIDAERVWKLVRALDGDDFSARTQAVAEVERLGDQVQSQLHEAARRAQSPERKRQLARLLQRLEAGGAEGLRTARAVEALEQMRTKEARQLLESLAVGEREVQRTRLARAACKRLHEREDH